MLTLDELRALAQLIGHDGGLLVVGYLIISELRAVRDQHAGMVATLNELHAKMDSVAVAQAAAAIPRHHRSHEE